MTAAALCGLAVATDLPLALACTTLVGGGLILFFVTAQSLIQLGATDDNRGRVMGVWSMITAGALPLGNLLQGWMADYCGVAATLLVGGIGTFGIAAFLLVFFALAPRSVAEKDIRAG